MYRLSAHPSRWLPRILLQMMPGPNPPFGPDKYGGDGTLGPLGPAFLVNPGQTLNLLVRPMSR